MLVLGGLGGSICTLEGTWWSWTREFVHIGGSGLGAATSCMFQELVAEDPEDDLQEPIDSERIDSALEL